MAEIIDYTPEPATNEYDDVVRDLIAAGEGKAVKLDPIPADMLDRHRRRFGQAANRFDKSPSPVSTVENEDGTVVLTYALTAKRGRKGATVEDAAPGA